MLFVFLLLTPCTVASGCTLWATLSVFVTKSPASVCVSLFCPFDFLMRRIITAVTLFSSTNTCFFFFFGMKLTQSNLLNSRQFWLVVLNYRCFFLLFSTIYCFCSQCVWIWFSFSLYQVPWNPDVDLCWLTLESAASDECEPEWCKSEDPLFILYTSGSTGKPKVIFHTTVSLFK